MNTSKRKLKRKPGWYILVSILLFVLLYFMYVTSLRITNIWRLVNMKRQEERLLKEALQKMERLKLERDRLLNDPEYIEEIARKEYGMFGKDEEIFQITLPDSGGNGKITCPIKIQKAK